MQTTARTLAYSLPLLPLALAATSGCTDPLHDDAFIQGALEDLVQSEVHDNDFIGIGISVRLADGRVFRADAGHDAPDAAVAYDVARTEQVIGSVTKLYTAVMIMQLVESGDLALDDSLARWFDFPDAGSYTVANLLEHTTPFGEFLDSMSREQLGQAWTPDELVERALGLDRVGDGPLAQAVYTNTNFVLLAIIVEAVTGQSWQHNLALRITDPLGLEHTYYAGDSDKADDLAGGWMFTPGGWIDVLEHLDPSIGWGGGALVSTNDELMRFTQALFAGELFDDPATLAAMTTFDTVMDPAFLGDEPPSSVGLCIIRMQLDGVRLEGHLGHQLGINAGALRDPDSGALIVVTSNDDRAFAGYPALKVAKFIRSL